MINPENKLVIFDLIYRYVYEEESAEKLNMTITKLKTELDTLEAADIAVMDPGEFTADLKTQWQEFLRYKEKV